MKLIEIAFKIAETMAKAYLPGIEVEFIPDKVFKIPEGVNYEPGAIKVSAPWNTDVLYLALSESNWTTILEMNGIIEDVFHTSVLMEDAIWFTLTAPIAWEIHTGVASLDGAEGEFKAGSDLEHFIGLRTPNSIYDQKIRRWLSSGDFEEHETVEGIVNAACREFDKTHINDGLTDVIFQGEDGNYYMLEAVIHATRIDKSEALEHTGCDEEEEEEE